MILLNVNHIMFIFCAFCIMILPHVKLSFIVQFIFQILWQNWCLANVLIEHFETLLKFFTACVYVSFFVFRFLRIIFLALSFCVVESPGSSLFLPCPTLVSPSFLPPSSSPLPETRRNTFPTLFTPLVGVYF